MQLTDTPVLALPDMTDGDDLWNFYREFVTQITVENDQSLAIYGLPEEFEKLDIFNSNICRLPMEERLLHKIWIRDYAPVRCRNTVKFTYNPSYFILKEHPTARKLDAFGQTLLSREQQTTSSIVLDGGNFIWNGAEDVIVTTKIFADNAKLSYDCLEEELMRVTGAVHIRQIGYDPFESTGHADGYVRFISEDHVLVAAMPADYTIHKGPKIKRADYLFTKELLDGIADYLGRYYKVTRVTHCIPLRGKKHGVCSAFGCYVNYMKNQNIVYLPQFGVPVLDQAAIDLFATLFPAPALIVPVDCRALAEYGGVLNCITWNC